jgi:gliding motility-associated lipoprotein GldD
MKTLANLLLVLLLGIFAVACHQHDYAPKPRGYFRIAFPAKAYQTYTGACDYTFDYPKYAVVMPDEHRDAKPCWLNVYFPQFGGTIHLSYEKITSPQMFNALVEDAHTFAFKHTVKASSIDEGAIAYPDRRVYGIYYTIEGNAASSAQFFLTDSTSHYIRGALYFNSEPRLDSIAPVLDFVARDMKVMIKTFRWK